MPSARLLAVFGLFFITLLSAADKPLQIYLIDVEGGQATLFVTPSGQSLLVDTGWGYNAYRDANRILEAAKMAKVKKIDYVLITHYHTDHVGGVPQLIAKMPVDTFVDHGQNREDTNATNHLYSDYEKAVGSSQRITGVPGKKLPLKGLDVTFVSADGKVLDQPLSGAGQPNNACQNVSQKAVDPSENARSLGFVMTFGKFTVVDLGDLTWNKELDLMCPNNKLGTTDLLIVSHHGLDQSNSPALVHGLHPKVAVIDNGAKKGGVASAWNVVKSSPGLKAIWQLHFADAAGAEHNAQDPYIANTNEADTGRYLKVTAYTNGKFEVYNPRNKFSEQY